MATTQTTARDLRINIGSGGSGTWTQLKAGDGTDYLVPSGFRADLKTLEVDNLGANSVTLNFARSADNTITDLERFGPPAVPLATGQGVDCDTLYVIEEGMGIWVRATGTTPNVTVIASILEVEE